jgi:hypothetical protein
VSGIFETQRSTPKRRLSVPRLIAAGALALLTGALIAGCAATAPAVPAARTAVATTVAPTAGVVSTATIAAAPAAPAAAAAPKAHLLGRLPAEPAPHPR